MYNAEKDIVTFISRFASISLTNLLFINSTFFRASFLASNSQLERDGAKDVSQQIKVNKS